MTVSSSLTPTRLRIILFVTLALIVLAGAGIFYLAYANLSKTAAEAGERAASAKQSEDTVQRLQSLESEMNSKRETINTVSQIMADSQNYAYQDRLVSDLTIYANRANLTIRNISFTTAQAAGSAGAEAGGAAAGLKKATVDITLDNPVNYQELLNFLHYIEQNLTKLKVSRVVMTKSEGDDVTIDILNLEVYVR